MSDIVERLRQNSRSTSYRPSVDDLILEAADEIERLRRAYGELAPQAIALRAEVGHLRQQLGMPLETERENTRIRELLRKAREWIDATDHALHCGVWFGGASMTVGGETITWQGNICTCGRDALLKVMEVPK